MKFDANVDEVTVDNDLSMTRIKWQGFDRYRETANLILLITEDDAKLIIPKRAIPDPATMDALMSLIQTSIPKGQFLPREMRFPVVPLPVQPIV